MIPYVTLKLDKIYKLRFGMGAMLEFERLTEMKLADVEDEMPVDVAFKILWVMLRQDKPDLTLEEASALVDNHAKSIRDVITKVKEAIFIALSDEENKNEEK